MQIEIKEVISKSDYKKFINLPYTLYKNNKYWVPPIKSEELKNILPDKNPAFKSSEAKFWIATQNNICIGRIGCIIQHDYNKKMNEHKARFTRIEFIDDYRVSEALIKTVENYAKSKGYFTLQGPLGFNNLDGQGLLVEGFDYLQSIGSIYHLPYYKTHLEKFGYVKETDWIEFRLSLEDKIPEKATKLIEIIKKRYKLKVRSYNTKSELKPMGYPIFKLINDTFKELFSVTAFSDDMIKFYMDKYFNILNPNFVKTVLNAEDKLVGFIIAIPSLSEAMQKANGKIFPFGIFAIQKALKKPKEVDLLLTGIDPKLQGQGVSALLIYELQKEMLNHNVKHVETTGIFETNHKAIQHWKNYKHIQHKRKRCYTKELQ